MNEPIAAITGHKVKEDDFTRWAVVCYTCKNLFGEPSKDPEDLKETLNEHLALHKEKTPE